MEVQRRYLGGDGEHSILVKGLDHSLLEQNKARAALSTEDDDALEEAFMEATSHTPTNVPKKRTREELIRDLKEQRARDAEQQGPKTVDEEARLLEEAKQKGKFKPIGFKPIGSISEGKKKKEKRSADDVERKKKKRKVDIESSADKAAGSKDSSLMPPPPIPTKAQVKPKTPEPEGPIDDDFNIFADAGEYEGIDIGDDDDDDDENVPRVTRKTEERDESSSSTAPQRWIPDETEPPSTKPSIPPLSKATTQSPPSSHKVVSEDEAEDDRPIRLVPLSSSALPSIKDFLAMEQAGGSYDKKKKRKGKKKAGADDDNNEGQKQKSVEAKVDRDYKRLIPILSFNLLQS